jgi:hypothetical protein
MRFENAEKQKGLGYSLGEPNIEGYILTSSYNTSFDPKENVSKSGITTPKRS